MQYPPLPANEALRLAALDSFDLLYTPAEERFDRIARVVAQALDAPIALVTLVGAGQQWFKSRVGLALAETPREVSFCAHAVASGELLVVPDALHDSRFFDNPLVTGAPGIRFYAGVPLRLAYGMTVGTLCAIDRRARSPSDKELSTLMDMARVAETELEQERGAVARAGELALYASPARDAMIDGLTGSWNRAGFELLLREETARAQQSGQSFALLILTVDDLEIVADAFGREAAEQVLCEAASRLRRAVGGVGTVTRCAEDAFVLVISPCDRAMLTRVQRRTRAALQGRSAGATGEPKSGSISCGGAIVGPPGYDATLALVNADRRLSLSRRHHV
jgi:diguanylate cyclase (GGDEF)-like protein